MGTPVPEKGNNKLKYILLAVIILLELIWTSYNFVYKKDSFHSDEIWSYGLANSFYQPFVYQKPGIHIDHAAEDDYINYREWMTGKTLNDYITVQEGERLSYASVFDNQTLDHHPPLYYMLLHTVCSFFPDTFSWGFGFFLNCIFLTVTQIFLYKTGKVLLKSGQAALTVCLLYGGSIGALSTFIFIRQYSLLTMLIMMYVYFCTRLYSDPDNKKRIIPVLTVSFAAFMTHYYAIIFIGVFTAGMCIYMLCRKRLGMMLIYGFSMLGTLGLFFAAYPAALRHMFDSNITSVSVSGFLPQMRILINYSTRDLFGLNFSSEGHTVLRIIAAVLAGCLIVFSLICFVFRKNDRIRHIAANTADRFGKLAGRLSAANYIPVFIFAASAVLTAAINMTTDCYYMGEYASRYVFCLYPCICLLAGLLFRVLTGLLPVIKRYRTVIMAMTGAVLMIVMNIRFDSWFYFRNFPGGADAQELFSEKNCVVVLPEESEWLITCLSGCMNKADNIFVTDEAHFEEDLDRISSLGERINTVVFADAGFDSLPESVYTGPAAGYVAGDEQSSDIRHYEQLAGRIAGGREINIEAYLNIFNGYAAVLCFEEGIQ